VHVLDALPRDLNGDVANQDPDYRPRPPRDREMMERETDAAFEALACIPNTFLRPSPGRPMPGFVTAALAAASAAFASLLAFRSARTLSAASSASVFAGISSGAALGFFAMVPSMMIVT
jgi:hypothetical protein